MLTVKTIADLHGPEVNKMFAPARIIIPSWLGDTPDKRKKRLANHLKQRETLRELFPPESILSICSDYRVAEKQALKAFPSLFVRRRTKKFRIHNWAMSRLYQGQGPGVILFLDDEIVPWPVPDFPNVDPVKILNSWLKHPKEIPGPLVYFGAKGLLADAYYRGRKEDIVQADLGTVGWATLVRNDLQVLFSDFTEDVHVIDDYEFPIRCSYFGKLVLKHQRLFFRSLSGTSNKMSTLVNGREGRLHAKEVLRAKVRKKYAALFDKRGKPLWLGRAGERGHRSGGLVHYVPPYGYVPIPQAVDRVQQRANGFFD